MERKKSRSSVIGWFKQPSSLISIISIIISLITFFLVNEYKGKLIIVLPDRIQVSDFKNLSFEVPLVITNTGAPKTAAHVIRITCNLEDIIPLQKKSTNIKLLWRMESKYVPRPGSDHLHDSLGYVNRVVPFAIHGGNSVEKIYNFRPIGNGFENEFIDKFSLKVYVETDQGAFYSKKTFYNCNNMEGNHPNFQFCYMPFENYDN
jgi:hypothetical protein